jgi:hypothetical protein
MWRDQGNALFKQGHFEAARTAYSNGITEGTQSSDEKHALLSNRAACLLELGEFAAAASDCREIMETDPCHAKAHFRLAKAYLRQGDMRAASIAACCALALCGQDASVLNLYQEVDFEQPNSSHMYVQNNILALFPVRADRTTCLQFKTWKIHVRQ